MTDDLQRRIDLHVARIKAYAATPLGQLASCVGQCAECSRADSACESYMVLLALYWRLLNERMNNARPVKEAP